EPKFGVHEHVLRVRVRECNDYDPAALAGRAWEMHPRQPRVPGGAAARPSYPCPLARTYLRSPPSFRESRVIRPAESDKPTRAAPHSWWPFLLLCPPPSSVPRV